MGLFLYLFRLADEQGLGGADVAVNGHFAIANLLQPFQIHLVDMEDIGPLLNQEVEAIGPVPADMEEDLLAERIAPVIKHLEEAWVHELLEGLPGDHGLARLRAGGSELDQHSR